MKSRQNMKKIIPMEKERLHVCRLDLDSPRLPSARRSASSADTNLNRADSIRDASSSKLSMMVPFSWESSPGVAKDYHQKDVELDALPPKPPPCRWYPKNEGNVEYFDRDHSEGSSDYGDAFSDVFDSVSLTEQLGIAGRLSSFQGLGFKDMEEIRNQPPKFIMDRFLPAANAIASSSVKKPRRRNSVAAQMQREPPMRETNNIAAQMGSSFVQNTEIQKEMASRACGLMVFFPWKLKPIVCGFNSPTNKIKIPRVTNLSTFSPRRSKREARHDGELLNERANHRENQGQRLDMGLPFIDTSRLTSPRSLNNLLQREATDEKIEGFNGEAESLPKLKPPAESWLSHTLGSVLKIN